MGQRNFFFAGEGQWSGNGNGIKCGIMLKNAWEIHSQNSSMEGNRAAGGRLQDWGIRGVRDGPPHWGITEVRDGHLDWG